MHRMFLILILALISACGPSISKEPIAAVSPSAAGAEAEKESDRLEQTVYITNSGKKYHDEGCRHLSKSKVAIKLKDAQARGYTACRVCKP